MHADGANRRHLNSAMQESGKVFSRMSRYLGRISKKADIHSVHRFRTHSRRVEALVEEFVPESGNKSKLLKQLSKLRKKAGKLRDLDVQLAFLDELKMPDRQNHRAELMHQLREEKARRAKKLAKSFASDRVRKVRKRLGRAKKDMRFDGADALQLAFKRLPKPQASAMNEQSLHACRIAAKRARYLAELAGDTPGAAAFIDELKRAQDEIGQWHDVLKLEARAKKLFGGVRDSALVSALQNISRARFRRASAALHGALAAIEKLHVHSAEPKPATSASLAAQATAAA